MTYRDAEITADSVGQALLTESGAEPIRFEWAWEGCELWEAARGTTASNHGQHGEMVLLSSGEDGVIVNMWRHLQRFDLRWGVRVVRLYRHFRLILP